MTRKAQQLFDGAFLIMPLAALTSLMTFCLFPCFMRGSLAQEKKKNEIPTSQEVTTNINSDIFVTCFVKMLFVSFSLFLNIFFNFSFVTEVVVYFIYIFEITRFFFTGFHHVMPLLFPGSVIAH